MKLVILLTMLLGTSLTYAVCSGHSEFSPAFNSDLANQVKLRINESSLISEASSAVIGVGFGGTVVPDSNDDYLIMYQFSVRYESEPGVQNFYMGSTTYERGTCDVLSQSPFIPLNESTYNLN